MRVKLDKGKIPSSYSEGRRMKGAKDGDKLVKFLTVGGKRI